MAGGGNKHKYLPQRISRLTAKEERQDKSTEIVALSAPLRLLNQLGHEVLVPEKSIVGPAPDGLFRCGFLPDAALVSTLVLPLQRIRQVPSVREPQLPISEAVLDEGDEFLFHRVIENGVCGGNGRKGKKTEICCLVDRMREETTRRSA